MKIYLSFEHFISKNPRKQENNKIKKAEHKWCHYYILPGTVCQSHEIVSPLNTNTGKVVTVIGRRQLALNIL